MDFFSSLGCTDPIRILQIESEVFPFKETLGPVKKIPDVSIICVIGIFSSIRLSTQTSKVLSNKQAADLIAVFASPRTN